MRIVITGGAGFVGTHLTNKLVELGHKVLVVDNLFAGRQDWIHHDARFERVDLGTVPDAMFIALMRSFDPEYAVHLASIHYIPYCQEHPEQTFASNVRSTELLIRSLSGLATRKVVGASTADVYSVEDIVHRETEILAPCNPYGLSKALSEQLLAYAARTQEALCAACLRLNNIYGPFETNPHLIPRILEWLASPNLPEIRMGYLGGTRDFIHVCDVVDAITAVLFNETGKYECFNVGTGKPTSARQVVQLLQEAVGDRRPVIEDSTQFRTFDRKTLSSDVTKIYEHVGWKAQIRLSEGLGSLVSSRSMIDPIPPRFGVATAAAPNVFNQSVS